MAWDHVHGRSSTSSWEKGFVQKSLLQRSPKNNDWEYDEPTNEPSKGSKCRKSVRQEERALGVPEGGVKDEKRWELETSNRGLL
jgi:hypothetical protein